MAKNNPTPLTDTPAYKLTNGIYRWFVVTLLWILCSLPVITVGAATCAALGEFSDPENYYSHKLVKDYFRRFGSCFAQGTILWTAFLLLTGLLVLDVTFYQQLTNGPGWGMTVAMLVLGNCLLGYVRFGFYQIAAEERVPFPRMLKQAGRKMLMCLPAWAIMAAVDLIVLSTLIRIPYLLVLLAVLPGIYANVHCLLIRMFMKRYEPDEDE